ncbi:MAG TPA: hypothetical protein VEA81_06635 [Burkholderiaceae bacterium]|nr:hypothetical protein [Burkholderiaceae bacterium]
MPILFFTLIGQPRPDLPGTDARPGALLEIDHYAAAVLRRMLGGERGQLRREHLTSIRVAARVTGRSSDLRVAAQAIERHGSVEARLL